MKIQFLGAARQVTGSNYLVKTDDFTFLVDFGQFQGTESINNQNLQPMTFDPKAIDFVILTHAHIDHCGRLPLLTKAGFTGKIYCSYPTAELAAMMLIDSGKIHEEENHFENQKRLKAGLEPAEPLFTVEDAENCAAYLYPLELHRVFEISPKLSLEFNDTGHLLGSASLRLTSKEAGQVKRVVFSGDIGTGNNPFLKSPEYWDQADYVIMESTYAMKTHEGVEERGRRLSELIEEGMAEGGTILIPAFSLGRTQEVMYILKNYYEKHRAPGDFEKIPIYIDSPLAIAAASVYKHHLKALKPEIAALYQSGFNPMESENVHYVKAHDASMALNKSSAPKVIISASGMCEAGRIRHHLKHFLSLQNTRILFVGYQGEGTLGRTLQEGKMTSVKLMNDTIAVRAQIHSLKGFSGHGDSPQLLAWLKAMKGVKQVFVTHGEAPHITEFAELIQNQFNITACVPFGEEEFEF